MHIQVTAPVCEYTCESGRTARGLALAVERDVFNIVAACFETGPESGEVFRRTAADSSRREYDSKDNEEKKEPQAWFIM